MTHLEWYHWLAIISFAIFFIKLLLSWMAQDIDIDADFDADPDFSLGEVVSFKGIIHFLMGFSGWLCLSGPSVTNYIIAAAIGILLMFGLFFLYQQILKLDHIPTEVTNFIGKSGVITVTYNNHYYVEIRLDNGTQEVEVYSDTPHKNGDMVTISEFKNDKYFIK